MSRSIITLFLITWKTMIERTKKNLCRHLKFNLENQYENTYKMKYKTLYA